MLLRYVLSRADRQGHPYDDGRAGRVKFTEYFEVVRGRPDRAMIRLEWIERAIQHPVREMIQASFAP